MVVGIDMIVTTGMTVVGIVTATTIAAGATGAIDALEEVRRG